MKTLAVIAGATLAWALLGSPLVAMASDSFDDDQARLAQGQTVSYPQTLMRRGRRYIGGVTYTVVDASIGELTGLFNEASAYRQVLPHTRDARFVGQEGPDRLVEILQGNSLVQAVYTLRMHDQDSPRSVRFWLDRSRPHGIADAWGFFRVAPLADSADGSPRVLLTYGVLVDLGPGFMRDFFESRIQAGLLSVPERLRSYAAVRFRSRPRA
jgi:hypothetical protein